MKNDRFESVGEWRKAVMEKGYSVPLVLCYGLTMIMKELGLSFKETFELLVREKKIVLADKAYIYDLSAHNAWLKETKNFRNMIK